MSHTVERHTRWPTVAVQVATLAGVDGSETPFASFGSHIPCPPAAALHHWDERHCASVVHPDVHRPLVVSHTLPMWPTQSAFVEHMPHCPMFVPVRKQNGSLIEPHASVAVLPKSPLHGPHVDGPVLQTGCSLGQVAELVHCTHSPLVVLHAGVLPEHWELVMHPTQTPAWPQIVERQSVGPSALVHGPSPLA